jgi:uncharacterized membrane protein
LRHCRQRSRSTPSCTLGEGEIYQVTAKAAASVAIESFFGTTEIIAAENHVCRSAQPASQLFSLNMLALILERETSSKTTIRGLIWNAV